MIEEHKAKGETVFSGADAFKLYDTYGFPIDLTIEMAGDEGMTVDQEGFQKLMEEQRIRARKAREALGDLAWAGIDLGLDDATPTTFTGYDGKLTAEGKILAIVTDGEPCSSIRHGRGRHCGAGSDPLLCRDGRSRLPTRAPLPWARMSSP